MSRQKITWALTNNQETIESGEETVGDYRDVAYSMQNIRTLTNIIHPTRFNANGWIPTGINETTRRYQNVWEDYELTVKIRWVEDSKPETDIED